MANPSRHAHQPDERAQDGCGNAELKGGERRSAPVGDQPDGEAHRGPDDAETSERNEEPPADISLTARGDG